MRLYLGIETDEPCSDILRAFIAPSYRQLTDGEGGIGDGSGGLALLPTGVTPGTYGDATHVGQFTVAADGRITAAVDVAITAGGAAGSAGEVQYNDGSGGFASDPAFLWDTVNVRIHVGAGTSSNTYIGSGPNVYADDSTFLAQLATGSEAGLFTASGQAVTICDGSIALQAATGFKSVELANATHAVYALGGGMRVAGTSGNTYDWSNAATAPTPQTLSGGLPVFVYASSATPAAFLAEPDAWVLINVNGVNYKVPAYL